MSEILSKEQQMKVDMFVKLHEMFNDTIQFVPAGTDLDLASDILVAMKQLDAYSGGRVVEGSKDIVESSIEAISTSFDKCKEFMGDCLSFERDVAKLVLATEKEAMMKKVKQDVIVGYPSLEFPQQLKLYSAFNACAKSNAHCSSNEEINKNKRDCAKIATAFLS